MITESLIIGLILGFLFYELFDISPGGVISPGYCALFITQPEKILMTLIIAIIIWGILKHLAKNFIIYGKRRFLAAVLLSFLLKLLIENYIQPWQQLPFDLISIGYIIPGLIANEMIKQKPVKTISALGIVSILVYLVLILVNGIRT